MIYRLGFTLLWISFLLYAFLLAPPDDPATFDLIKRMSTGDVAGINPLIVAEFNLMGLLPLVYFCLLLVDGDRQRSLGKKIRAWPFALLMMGVGAFALLPYLILRRPLTGTEPLPPPRNLLLRICQSRWIGGLALPILGLLIYGVLQGDWTDFGQQWQSSRFIHVMSLDFLLLIALLSFLTAADQVGRQAFPQPILWIPLLGPLAYLCWRPQPQRPAASGEDPMPTADLSLTPDDPLPY